MLHENLNQTSHITLNHKQNNLKIDFANTDYVDPKGVSYRYQMVGYDKTPITVAGNQNFAAYTNLPKGDYKFRLEVANSNGVWNTNVREITFKIVPHPLQSTYAYILYVLIIMATVLAFGYFLYNRNLLRYKLRIKEIEQEKELLKV